MSHLTLACATIEVSRETGVQTGVQTGGNRTNYTGENHAVVRHQFSRLIALTLDHHRKCAGSPWRAINDTETPNDVRDPKPTTLMTADTHCQQLFKATSAPRKNLETPSKKEFGHTPLRRGLGARGH